MRSPPHCRLSSTPEADLLATWGPGGRAGTKMVQLQSWAVVWEEATQPLLHVDMTVNSS